MNAALSGSPGAALGPGMAPVLNALHGVSSMFRLSSSFATTLTIWSGPELHELTCELNTSLARYRSPSGSIGNGLYLLTGSSASPRPPSTEDYAKVLVPAAARIGSERVAELFAGWLEDVPARRRKCALLRWGNFPNDSERNRSPFNHRIRMQPICSMKIQLVSDLHLEFHNPLPELAEDADVIVCAGDLAPIGMGAVGYPAEEWADAGHILYVPGNHEFYGTDIDRARKQRAGLEWWLFRTGPGPAATAHSRVGALRMTGPRLVVTRNAGPSILCRNPGC